IETRTLLRRRHESVDRRRVGIATDDVADALADRLALGLAELPVVEERELDAAAEVEDARDRGHAVERPCLAPEVALERGADEVADQRAVATGDREAVVERGELGTLCERERGDEVPARHPVAAVEARAVLEGAVGERAPELLQLGGDRGDARL